MPVPIPVPVPVPMPVPVPVPMPVPMPVPVPATNDEDDGGNDDDDHLDRNFPSMHYEYVVHKPCYVKSCTVVSCVLHRVPVFRDRCAMRFSPG